MGRLTYINRKIEGDKLARVASRDIAKRIPPKPSYKAALRDPIIEFDISGKSVEDDGLKIISEELLEAINHKSLGRVLILEEVSLRGNNFSAQGLAHFAAVIKASGAELRSLDLSENCIEIKDAADAEAWERFLQSLSQCSVLHRLDLSGNKLDHKGFELLLKNYASQDQSASDEATRLGHGCGLRSIPYLCLSDTGLDDVCAMYLSYILESHGLAGELLHVLPQPKAGSQAHHLEAYSKIEGCNGIIWKPNAALSDLGVRVLESAEALRKTRHGAHSQDDTETGLVQSMDDMALSNSQKSPTNGRSRGDSLVDPDDSFYSLSSGPNSDLTRARSRILLEALRNGKIQQNNLWSTAFRVLQYSRALLYGFEISVGISSKTSRASNHLTEDKERAREFPALPSKITPVKAERTTLRIIDTGSKPRSALSKANPNIFTTRKTSSQMDDTEDKIPKHAHRSIYPKQRNPTDFRSYLRPETIIRYSKEYSSALPFGLPEMVWINIIAYAADAKGILSEIQQATAVRWAASRESVRELRMARGKHDSQQIYKALEGLDCLTYDM